MVYLQGVEGRPPSSNWPASSVTVVILSVPQIAVTAAPGIGCPPERTVPLWVSANAIVAGSAARIKNKPVVRNMLTLNFSGSSNSHKPALLQKATLSANQPLN